MMGILAFVGGLVALVWTAVIASVGIILLFALLVPLLVLSLFFRLGFVFLKVTVAFLIVCVAAAWLF